MSPLLQDSRVLLIGDIVQLNRGILADRPYEIMSDYGTRNAQEKLVGCRGVLDMKVIKFLVWVCRILILLRILTMIGGTRYWHTIKSLQQP